MVLRLLFSGVSDDAGVMGRQILNDKSKIFTASWRSRLLSQLRSQKYPAESRKI
jgi:hypothetical protein